MSAGPPRWRPAAAPMPALYRNSAPAAQAPRRSRTPCNQISTDHARPTASYSRQNLRGVGLGFKLKPLTPRGAAPVRKRSVACPAQIARTHDCLPRERPHLAGAHQLTGAPCSARIRAVPCQLKRTRAGNPNTGSLCADSQACVTGSAAAGPPRCQRWLGIQGRRALGSPSGPSHEERASERAAWRGRGAARV